MTRLLFAVLLFAATKSFANATTLLTSSEGTNSHQQGSSLAETSGSHPGFMSEVIGKPLPFRVSDYSMLMGPSIGDFRTDAPTSTRPFSGFSFRHCLRLDYKISDFVLLGPAFDVTENFFDSKDGSLLLNDPSLRLFLTDVGSGKIGTSDFKATFWLQFYAPASALSRQIHQYTAMQAEYLPSLHFRGSRFFLSGVASWKANLVRNQDATAIVTPMQLVGAFQGNYRVSRIVTFFLMDHVNANAGPPMTVPAVDSPDNYRRKAKIAQTRTALVTDGLMTGAVLQVSPNIGLSPRVDWQVNLPIETTTFGLNASLHVI